VSKSYIASLLNFQCLTLINPPCSELAGLAFDSLQQVLRKVDISIAVLILPLPFVDHQVWVVMDPVSPRPAIAQCHVPEL
jgi:hypothetical protein